MNTHRLALSTALSLALVPAVAVADVGDDSTSEIAQADGPPPPPMQRDGMRGRSGRRADGWYRTAKLLPDYGDYALGFDAMPFLSYVGNAFNNSTSNAPFVNYPQNDAAIMGKYFLDPDTAVRGRLRITAFNDVDRAAVVDDSQDPENYDPSDTVVDERYHRYFQTSIAGGIEKRRGHGRVQGIYGAEAMLGIAKDTILYGYGNAIEDDNPAPTTSNFAGSTYAASTRVLDDRPGGALSIAARAFVGAEFFLAPRVSIGGEFGYTAMAAAQRKGEVLVETYDFAEEERVELTYESPTSFEFSLSTDQLSGDIYLLIHF